MTLHDTRLIDFTAGELHDAITRAVDAVNSRGVMCKVAVAKIAVKRVADRVAAVPEGFENWVSAVNFEVHQNAGQVLVAWWTSAFGRRHARVIGRLVHHTRRHLVNQSVLGTRPPVWHVFPERVYRRRVGKANDIVAVCGCGACGSERTLAWAGPCCGPCCDYAQEHGAPPKAPPALLPLPRPCRAVAVSADGRWVAASTGDGLSVWDLDAGEKPVWESVTSGPVYGPPRVALSPDGTFLAVIGVRGDGLRVLRTADPDAPPSPVVPGAGSVAFSPDGAGVAYTASGRLTLARLPDLADPREIAPSVASDGPVAFSADGSRVAVRCGDRVEVHDLDPAAPPFSFPLSGLRRPAPQPPSLGVIGVRPGLARAVPVWLAVSPDGAMVATGVEQTLAARRVAPGEAGFREGKPAAPVTGVAFDGTGRWVFAATADGTLAAYRADTFDPDRTVTLRWGLGPIYALAATAAGDTLFTAVDEGVKAWPVGRLLEGL